MDGFYIPHTTNCGYHLNVLTLLRVGVFAIEYIHLNEIVTVVIYNGMGNNQLLVSTNNITGVATDP